MLSPARLIDHTLLKPETTANDIDRLCEEAVEASFAAVCIPPRFVRLASDRLYGSEVAVATVVGFPLGYSSRATKIAETSDAVASGADEIDMVIAIGNALADEVEVVEEEITAVVRAAERAEVKVILECCLLDDPRKLVLSEACVRAGAAFVKTSTGFSSGGATLDDVALLSQQVAGRIGVKAAGGIRDLVTFNAMCAAGATRIGTSSGLAILRQWRQQERS